MTKWEYWRYWALAGAVALSPIYVLLYLIYRELRLIFSNLPV